LIAALQVVISLYTGRLAYSTGKRRVGLLWYDVMSERSGGKIKEVGKWTWEVHSSEGWQNGRSGEKVVYRGDGRCDQ
jgi:hypothetical protein